MLGSQKSDEKYTSITLDIKPKGDKFLYYKRRLEMVEKTIKVFPFWNNAFIWFFVSFTMTALYFILFFIDKSYDGFNQNISLILFESGDRLLLKNSIYILLFIPLANFIITLLIGYKTYNKKRYITYTLLIANIICTSLFMLTMIKITQMNFAIIK